MTGRSTSDITPEMIPRFLALREAHTPVREIARLLGVRRGSVGRTVRRLGLQQQLRNLGGKMPLPPTTTASERMASGVAALEAGHPLSWGVIATGAWPR
jgi:hypothetical protein